jgi:hypothetical protein
MVNKSVHPVWVLLHEDWSATAVQINPWPQKGTEGAKMEKAQRLNFRIFATFGAFLWREKWPQNF